MHPIGAQRALGSPLAHLSLVWEKPRWEKGKGGFPEETRSGTGFHSMGQFFLAQRKLPDACSVKCRTVFSSLDDPSLLCLALPGL